jgi:hypothetical protein
MTSRQHQKARQARRRRGGGNDMMPLFVIMCIVVIGVIAGGFYFFSREPDEPDAEAVAASTPKRLADRPIDDRQPWSGTIAGRQITLAQGMDFADVRERLGAFDARRSHIYRPTVDVYYWFDDSDEATKALFTDNPTAVHLQVHVEESTGKVVWFEEPKRVPPQIRRR